MRAPPDSMKPTTGAPARPASRSTRMIDSACGLAERAAEVGRVLRVAEDGPAVDAAGAGDHAVARARLLAHALGHDVRAQEGQRPLVAQLFEPLQRREPAVDLSDGRLSDNLRCLDLAVDGDAHAASRHNTALWPPNPNAFESAIGRPPVHLQGLGLVRHVVEVHALLLLLPAQGGRGHLSRRARMVATASTAPAAPSRCPIADLVEDTGISPAWSPSASLIAFVSARSLSGVEVPWALT